MVDVAKYIIHGSYGFEEQHLGNYHSSTLHRKQRLLAHGLQPTSHVMPQFKSALLECGNLPCHANNIYIIENIIEIQQIFINIKLP